MRQRTPMQSRQSPTTVEEVVAAAREAVFSARAERDQLQHALEQADAKLERVRVETLKASVEPLAELIDHLGRALAAQPDPENPWFIGTAAVLARARSSLARLGVVPTGTVGETFDPRLHEAIGTLRTEDLPAGTIVDSVKTGLATTDGVLIRPASVVVAQGGPR